MKNTYLKFLCTAVVALVFSATARSQVVEQIEFDAIGNMIRNADNSLAAVGDAVLLGTFAPGFNFSANQTFSSLSAAFTQYGSTTMAIPGQFSGTTILTTAGQENKQLYVWVLNNSTAASADSWVILSNTASNWKVPADSGTGAQTILDTSDPGTFIPVGAFGASVFDMTSPNMVDWKMTNFAAVPEPSTYMLFGMGALGMMALRRRMKR